MLTRISAQIEENLRSAIAPHPLIVAPQTSVQAAIAKMNAAYHDVESSYAQGKDFEPHSNSVSGSRQLEQERSHLQARSRCVLVVEAGVLAGILTEREILRLCGEEAAFAQSLDTLPVHRVMMKPVVLKAANFKDDAVAERLLRQNPRQPLPVVGDRGEILGLVTHETLRQCRDEAICRNQQTTEPLHAQSDHSRIQQLRLELKLLENVLEVILAGYWDWDIANNYEYLSPGLKKMFGYSDDELPNHPESWQKLIFQDDLPAVLDCFERHVQSHGAVPFYNEVRYRHKDGSTVWVMCSGQVIEWDAAGKPLRMIGCHMNITRQKQTELQLQRSKEELERFFLITLDLLCIADTEGRFHRLNRAWETTLGYAIEEMEGQSFLSYVHPDDVASTLEAIATLDRQETVRSFVNRYRCKDGSYRSIEWYSRPYGTMIYAAARDITERLKVEQQLRKNDAHLKTAQRISKLGSWEFDPQTEAIHWSEEVFAIFGRDPASGPPSYEELIQLYHPDDQAYHDETVKQAIAAGQPYDLECRAYHPNGNLIYVQARGEPIFDAHGNLIQIVGTVLDITDRKQVEFDLRQTTAQLTASNKELEAFAYSVSHDLRSPLRAIDGFSQAILEDYGEQFDDTAQDYFNRIRRNTQRMSALIDDLLRLSRVSRSDMQLQRLNLSQMVVEQIEELRMAEPERRVEAIVAPDVTVRADPTLMRITLSNLLQNAWKFTSHHPTARIEFGFHQQNNQPVYFVSDDGAGFDMNYAGMLFGVFQRLHDTHEFPGTGIGLATVQRAIHRHGGTVWAQGAIEQGATVYFTLPPHPTYANPSEDLGLNKEGE